MRCGAGSIAVVLLLAVSGGTAYAGEAQSTGLYAPFPSLQKSGYIKRYMADFGVSVSSAQADRGAALGGRLAAASAVVPTTASPAARVRPGGGLAGSMLAGLAFALVAAGLGLLLLERRIAR
jgi:hypothetical protein